MDTNRFGGDEEKEEEELDDIDRSVPRSVTAGISSEPMECTESIDYTRIPSKNICTKRGIMNFTQMMKI